MTRVVKQVVLTREVALEVEAYMKAQGKKFSPWCRALIAAEMVAAQAEVARA